MHIRRRRPAKARDGCPTGRSGPCSEGARGQPMKRITLITLGFSIAACAWESPATPPPTAEDYDDTAQAIAASTVSGNGAGVSAGEVVAMTSSVSLARGELPLGFARRAD